MEGQPREREDGVGGALVEAKAKKAMVDIQCARQESRVTCGADVVIRNVLPFLQLL
jgi:hypothetical protein